MTARYGIQLTHVWDGVSVWVEEDGTVVNRWTELLTENPELAGTAIEDRARVTDQWLAERVEAS